MYVVACGMHPIKNTNLKMCLLKQVSTFFLLLQIQTEYEDFP